MMKSILQMINHSGAIDILPDSSPSVLELIFKFQMKRTYSFIGK